MAALYSHSLKYLLEQFFSLRVTHTRMRPQGFQVLQQLRRSFQVGGFDVDLSRCN
jgi:hypothetical protein